MSPAHFAVNFFVALFALIDPLGNTPLFAAATAGARPAGSRLTAAYIALFAFVFLAFFFVTGLSLLRFFGIGLAAFRIAGGVLLLLLGLDMARGQFAANLADATDAAELTTGAYARREFERLVVPFAMPLLIGPGAISTAVIYAGEARRLGFVGQLVGLAVIAATGLSIVASFWYAGLITRLLGRVGTIIVVRVLGLILCALAVQFMLAGVADSTVGVMRPTAATPYPLGI
jgi:multiple antibiotic resistance protein